MSVKAHLLEPTEQVGVRLRRYHSGEGWSCEEGWHQATSETIETIPVRFKEHEGRKLLDHVTQSSDKRQEDFEESAWPTHCEKGCGYEFTEEDVWQVQRQLIYERDTGETLYLNEVKPGDMWDAWWMPSSKHSPDGRFLIVVTPDGFQWAIDGQASNCTEPEGRTHKCWVRHGDPPNITVDKNGATCQAGGGSIGTPGYHGFLRDGAFT